MQYMLQATCYKKHATGYLLQAKATGHRHRIQATGYKLKTISYMQKATGY